MSNFLYLLWKLIIVNPFYQKSVQVRNQKFFRMENVLWNEGTPINILFTTQQRKTPQVKTLEFFFLLHALKTWFWIRHLIHRWTQLAHFFLKSEHFFRFSKKGMARPRSPRPTLCEPAVTVSFYVTDYPYKLYAML